MSDGRQRLGLPPPQTGLQVAIVGRIGGTHIGDSLRHAATQSGHQVAFFDVEGAEVGFAPLRSLAWRFDHRPIGLRRFSDRVAEACVRHPPDLMITTGAGGLTGEAVQAIRGAGTIIANYSTDDPWNPSLRARWHLKALPHYDVIFTPRRANIDDFRRHGCRDVHYLPFGYDERYAHPPETEPRVDDASDVLFVGGADRDRAAFMSGFARPGVAVKLAGGYWERFAQFRQGALGLKSPEALRRLTAAAKLNLCLVRRANRDGHVMRSLEIGAIGGCMLAEDTAEHRELLGPDGEAVVYFASPADAAGKAAALLPAQDERRRMAARLQARIASGRHTYGDRLAAMLAAALPADKLTAARPIAESAKA
jgi:hypothetical protein